MLLRRKIAAINCELNYLKVNNRNVHISFKITKLIATSSTAGRIRY